MEDDIRIVSINEENIDKEGFFCLKSRKKADGYLQKKEWLLERFKEGLKLHILYQGKRSFAFIEYLPGEYAWRAVNAAGTMFIHCIWTVGKGQKSGFAKRLLAICEHDAREAGMNGVTVLTSSSPWLVDAPFFISQGYQAVDQAPPSFKLLAKKFNDAPDPTLPKNWDERLQSYGDGLTIVHAAQCPYVPDAIMHIQNAADELGINSRTVALDSATQIREQAPSAYGIFNVVYNSRLLSYTYLLKKDLIKLLGDELDLIGQ